MYKTKNPGTGGPTTTTSFVDTIPMLILDSTMINTFLDKLGQRWDTLREEQQTAGRFIPTLPKDNDVEGDGKGNEEKKDGEGGGSAGNKKKEKGILLRMKEQRNRKKKPKKLIMVNKEKTDICNFGMTSIMMRELAPSICLYNNHLWI